MHVVAVVHETASRVLVTLCPASGLGVVCTVQAIPFQTSARVTSALMLGSSDPTAMHASDAVHDTPLSSLRTAPDGFCGDWIVQFVPSQASASVTSVPLLPVYSPTAMHAELEVHDTALSVLLVAPTGFGVVWIVQPSPFHASASVTLVPELST